MPVAFPSIQISQASNRSTKRDILTVSFGNGYEQRVPNGINYKREMWSVEWSGLTTSEKNAIETFLNAISAGDYTTWTSPLDSTSKKFVLDGEWMISDIGGAIWSITANFRQVYDV